ncbi:MAG: zf-HC2 domain-containing protein [Phycisphaerae bacterium]|nr:zf-HC2 domain-containing protein [Gemmatimonadaceae bacterium]
MTDCSNAEIRDLLPDYVHDQLSVADLARVEQHLVSCAECTDELALLQAMFDIRPNVAAVNVAAIVASLPKPGHRIAGSSNADSQHEAAFVASSYNGVRNIASAPSVVRKSGGYRSWRAIAAVAVFAVGTLSVAVVRQGGGGSEATPGIDSTGILALGPTNATNTDDSLLTTTGREVGLSVGDISDYSDEELKAIMARLDKWDGATSAEPLPGVPILPPGF